MSPHDFIDVALKATDRTAWFKWTGLHNGRKVVAYSRTKIRSPFNVNAAFVVCCQREEK